MTTPCFNRKRAVFVSAIDVVVGSKGRHVRIFGRGENV